MKRLLLIACGGTGQLVADSLRERLAVRYGLRADRGELPANLRILYVDTDTANPRMAGPEGVPLYLDGRTVERVRSLEPHDIEYWEDTIELRKWAWHAMLGDWNQMNRGTGKKPMLARLAMLVPSNFTNLRARIRDSVDALQKLRPEELQEELGLAQPPALGDQVSVCVVASTGGGTGNGLFIDMGYLLNRFVAEGLRLEHTGYWCIPDPMAKLRDRGVGRNTAVALTILDTVQSGYYSYWVKYPDEDMRRTWQGVAPYRYVYLVSPALEDAAATVLAGGLGDLIEVLATYLYHDCVWNDRRSPGQEGGDPVASRRTDIENVMASNALKRDESVGSPRVYFTCGLASMEFPAGLCFRQCVASVQRDILDGLSGKRTEGGSRPFEPKDLEGTDKSWLYQQLGLAGGTRHGTLFQKALGPHPYVEPNMKEFFAKRVRDSRTPEDFERCLAFAQFLFDEQRRMPNPKPELPGLGPGIFRDHILEAGHLDSSADKPENTFASEFLQRFADMCITQGKGPLYARCYLDWALPEVKAHVEGSPKPGGAAGGGREVREAIAKLRMVEKDRLVLWPLRGKYQAHYADECRQRLDKFFEALVHAAVMEAKRNVLHWLGRATSVLTGRAAGLDAFLSGWRRICEQTLDDTEESTPNRLVLWAGEDSVRHYVEQALNVRDDDLHREQRQKVLDALARRGLSMLHRAMSSRNLNPVENPFTLDLTNGDAQYPKRDDAPDPQYRQALDDLLRGLFRGVGSEGVPGFNVFGVNAVERFESDPRIENKTDVVRTLERQSSLLLRMDVNSDRTVADAREQLHKKFCLIPDRAGGGHEQSFCARLGWLGETRHPSPDPFLVIWTQEMGGIRSDIIAGFERETRKQFSEDESAYIRIDIHTGDPPSDETRGLIIAAFALGVLVQERAATPTLCYRYRPAAGPEPPEKVELDNDLEAAAGALERRRTARQILAGAVDASVEADDAAAMRRLEMFGKRPPIQQGLLGVPEPEDETAQEYAKRCVIKYAQAESPLLFTALENLGEAMWLPKWAEKMEKTEPARFHCRKCQYSLPPETTPADLMSQSYRNCPNPSCRYDGLGPISDARDAKPEI